MNLSKRGRIVFSFATGILLLVGLFLALHVQTVQANDGILYVSSTDPACGGQSPCYATIQGAVDAASDGDVIKVSAGIYTGVQTRAFITQVVYLSKSLTIQGGYTNANWSTANPDASPATLDAQGMGRGLVITGPISATVEGLRITGGDAAHLGEGDPPEADAGGGVYVCNTAKATIRDCVVYSNTASTAGVGYGGGIYLGQSDATLSGNKVISNTASIAGPGRAGGLYLADSTAILNDNLVQGNTAGTADWGDGGGLYSWYSTATLNGNTVRDNVASTAIIGDGGGLLFFQSTATLSGNTVQGNIATDAHFSSSGGRGGRLYDLGSDAAECGGIVVIQSEGGGLAAMASAVTLTSNTVISNTASTVGGGTGGGLSVASCSATLSGNTVQGNTASTSGELYSGGGGGGVDIHDSTATLTGNTVQGNTASTASRGDGGGIALSSSTATLSGNTVQGNTASTVDCGTGGGLFLGGADAILSGNMIISSMATLNPAAAGYGGGLRARYGSSITLINNIVAGNQANTEGSGLSFEGEPTYPTWGRLLHTTIADNHGGSGQGVYVGNYTALAFTNTIIAGHDNVGITVTPGSTATLEATLWYHNGLQTGGGGTVISSSNVYGDPAFANPSVWNYHLTASSAAIDKGVSAGVADDIDSDLRPVDGDEDGTAVVDIGADELVWRHIHLPLVVRNR